MSNKPLIISVIIFLSAIAGAYTIDSRSDPIVISTNLDKLPMRIGGFVATEDSFPETVYNELNADQHIYRHYWSSDGKRIDLYIGYYGTAKGGRTWHRPQGCLVASGWSVIDIYKVPLYTQKNPNGVLINGILARKGNQWETVLHWYQTEGTKVISNDFQANIQRFFGRILRNRNDGAFVRISILTSEEGISEANTLIKPFSEKLLSLIPNYWPVEE